jgi:hypothetical protein
MVADRRRPRGDSRPACPELVEEAIPLSEARRSASQWPIYFFIALPSITVVHFAPSCDISYMKLYEVAEVTLIV